MDGSDSGSYPVTFINFWVLLLPLIGPMIIPRMIDEHGVLLELWFGGGGNWSTRRETCLNVTLSTTHPTWIFLAQNPNLPCHNPATNSLRHDMTILFPSLRTPTVHTHHLSAYFTAWTGPWRVQNKLQNPRGDIVNLRPAGKEITSKPFY